MGSRSNEAMAHADAKTTFEQEYSIEVNKPVGAMSISPCGRDVVLASRQGLHIIDLDSLYRQPRHLPHHTPWEVADVQWSPFPARDYWVVSTSNQKALVWNLMMNDAGSAVEHYLHAHTRAITDINFSAHNPDILATCAVDSFVHCWDLRHPAKPALSFADWFAGATQVKWNRQDQHIIASSHDKFLHIWDSRKGAKPIHSIEAHDTKIYGLDWNRVETTALVTCSLDKTIKFWDYSVDVKKPKRVIETSFPIWRARHTPFGYGVLAMPQRDDYNVYLYKRRADAPGQDISAPVKTFPGHTGQVKEFLWRCRGNVDDAGIDHREFQLITWGADKILRSHCMEDKVLAGVGYVKGMKVDSKLQVTRSNAVYKTFRDRRTKASLETVKSSSSLHQHRNDATFEPVKTGLTLRGRSAGIVGGFLNSKINVQGKNNHKSDLDPISWMKGVKTGKKDATLDHGANADLMTDHRVQRGSEEFETLGEEIVHVGMKFSKVKFEKAEDKQRYVKFGMRGIWETNGSSTYLECRIDFPEDYPFNNTPNLTIEKTARLDRDILSKLEKDVEAIGQAYLKFKRNSLEAIVRYLHGDQSLDDALNWTKEDLDASMTEFPSVDESSSDEDDLGTANQDHDGEFGLTNSGFLETTNANKHMPLAKGCAGIWAQNGTLVCFFPPRLEASRGGPTLGYSRPEEIFRRSRKRKSDDLSKGHVSHGSRSTMQSSLSADNLESSSESESSESGQSSSASSVSSRDRPMKDVASFAQRLYRRDNFDFGTYSADKIYDGTLKSMGSGSVGHSRTPRSRSVVTLHDLRDLIPSKQNLAKEYMLSGSGACQHNSIVARKNGHDDLAEVWQLLGLVLYNIPGSSESFRSSQKWNEKTKAKREAAAQLKTTRSTLPSESLLHLSKFLDWSHHPFGKHTLIEYLFDYYARVADEQMLATMSCVLAEHDAATPMQDSSQLGLPQKFKFMSPSRKLQDAEYFPIFKKPSSISPEDKPFKTRISSLRSSLKPKTDSSSLSSSLGTVTIDSGSLGSTGTEMAVNRSFEGKISTSKLSTSPEWIRPLHRSSSTIANAIMTSIPRPFSLTTSAASSPPTLSLIKKKLSPMSSLSATGNDWTTTVSDVSGINDSAFRKEGNLIDRVRNKSNLHGMKGRNTMTATLKHQSQFDQALLSADRAGLYEIWRQSYATMLHSWDLLIARVELLKFSDTSAHGDSDGAHRNSSLTIGPDEKPASIGENVRHVVPLKHCSFCNNIRRAEDENGPCQTCSNAQIMVCVLCNISITARSSPCFVCGHMLHIECRESWQQQSYEATCPTGCGCNCSSPIIPSKGVVTTYVAPRPTVASPKSSRFASTYLTNSHSRHSSIGRSATTTPGFGNADRPNQNSPLTQGLHHSLQDRANVESSQNSNYQATPQIAYAALQSLAAQDRSRGEISAAISANPNTHSSEKDASSSRSSKMRQSKSLMFVAGLGSTSQTENRKGSKHGPSSARSTSGTSTPANAVPSSSAASSSSASVRGKSARRGTPNRNNLDGGFALRNRADSMHATTGGNTFGGNFVPSQQEELAFELGFDDEDDSDIEERGF